MYSPFTDHFVATAAFLSRESKSPVDTRPNGSKGQETQSEQISLIWDARDDASSHRHYSVLIEPLAAQRCDRVRLDEKHTLTLANGGGAVVNNNEYDLCNSLRWS